MSTDVVRVRSAPSLFWLAFGAVLPAELLLLCCYGHLAGLVTDGDWWLLFGGRVNPAALAAGVWTAGLWYPLSWSTLRSVHALLALVFPQPVCDLERMVVGTTTFSVHVAQGCSGYESIGLIWVFLAFQLWAQRRAL